MYIGIRYRNWTHSGKSDKLADCCYTSILWITYSSEELIVIANGFALISKTLLFRIYTRFNFGNELISISELDSFRKSSKRFLRLQYIKLLKV